jgi:hypothetical protein
MLSLDDARRMPGILLDQPDQPGQELYSHLPKNHPPGGFWR